MSATAARSFMLPASQNSTPLPSSQPGAVNTDAKKFARIRANVERRYLWMTQMHDRIRAKVLSTHAK